jgi:hypothetical protein
MPVVANRNDLPAHKDHAPVVLVGSPDLRAGPFLLPRGGSAPTNEPLPATPVPFVVAAATVARSGAVVKCGLKPLKRWRFLPPLKRVGFHA